MHVIAVAACQHSRDVPLGVAQRDDMYTDADDDWLCDGYSTIVKADGSILAGPLVKETGILYAELDAANARSQRRAMDPVGHYSRPDVFHLSVNTTSNPLVGFDSAPQAAGVAANGTAAAPQRRSRSSRAT